MRLLFEIRPVNTNVAILGIFRTLDKQSMSHSSASRRTSQLFKNIYIGIPQLRLHPLYSFAIRISSQMMILFFFPSCCKRRNVDALESIHVWNQMDLEGCSLFEDSKKPKTQFLSGLSGSKTHEYTMVIEVLRC